MNTDIVRKFVEFINRHDVEAMCTLMTDDHQFIDAHEHVYKGRDKMKESWRGYFAWFPDYTIEISDMLSRDDVVVVTGHASGTFSEPGPEEDTFRVPAAWRAELKDGHIQLWQVFCDTNIPFEILGRHINEEPEEHTFGDAPEVG